MKFLVIVLVIFITAIIEVTIDRAMGIDLSDLSAPKIIIHNLVYKLSGMTIAACVFFL